MKPPKLEKPSAAVSKDAKPRNPYAASSAATKADLETFKAEWKADLQTFKADLKDELGGKITDLAVQVAKIEGTMRALAWTMPIVAALISAMVAVLVRLIPIP